MEIKYKLSYSLHRGYESFAIDNIVQYSVFIFVLFTVLSMSKGQLHSTPKELLVLYTCTTSDSSFSPTYYKYYTNYYYYSM